MRKQNHSIPSVLKPDTRLNNSVTAARRCKRPNAQKHGVFAEPLILPGEDPREFEALHARWIEEWNPSGPSEESRVFGCADAEWRKLRSRRFVQTKAIANSLTPSHPAFDEARGLMRLATSFAVNLKLLSQSTRATSCEPRKSDT